MVSNTATVTFNLSALFKVIRWKPGMDWFGEFGGGDLQRDGVVIYKKDAHVFVLDSNARKPQARVTILLDESGFMSKISHSGLTAALQRIHRIGVQAAGRQLSFPRNWSQFTAGNLVTLFAYPRFYGSERLIAYIEGKQDPVDVCICAVTSDEEQIVLPDYQPDVAQFKAAIREYPEVAAEATADLTYLEKEELPGVVDLDMASFGAVVGHRTYSQWLPYLSLQQKAFLDSDPSRSVKLRGPAGSGKTLAMELKVLHELYRAEDEGREARILFATHSWSVTNQVQAGLERLDERDALQSVDVFPLLTLAEIRMGNEGSVRVLGDDSFSGKAEQLKTLARLVKESREGNWLAFRGSTSSEFRERIEAEPGGPEFNRLLWDLMLEFACVIGAKGILPGINAAERYKELERRPWMMPLSNESEISYVFHLYSELVAYLRQANQMTSDQIVNDYLSLLATYRWHAERRTEGYDLIFVDEFHLFNEQERMVFHHLSRDPDRYPVVYMAMDPRQSPAEYYADFGAPGVGARSSGAAERTLGASANIDLQTVYRYTPEILAVLHHLDRYYPALELGADWGVSVSEAKTSREAGAPPKFWLHSSAEIECEEAIREASALNKSGKQVALLCLDTESFVQYKEAVSRVRAGANFQVMESREDAETLHYTSRSIVLSQPHYVAGLQFDAVVLAGCRPTFYQYDPFQAYGLRRFLSDVYLGASRARDVLHFHGSGREGEFPPVLETAFTEKVILLQDR